jgi:SAM-dependent methyltransferase
VPELENSNPVFQCPACRRGAIGAGADAWVCDACSKRFPLVDGIPWLHAEPEATLADWRLRLHWLLTELRNEAAATRQELEQAGLRLAVRNRLKLQATACDDHARRLAALLAPLGIDDLKVANEWHRALGTRAPRGPGISAYYVNLHRDWAWGRAETDAMYAQVEAALGGHRAGRVLVLGAGAGRLVHDLAHRADADVVIALDVNPLLAIVGRRVMNGERVSLYEFPLAPTDGNAFAILRTLALDAAPARAPVHWVLADASAAPFAAESFDTVVTPWLVDVIDEELARFAARINTLLRTGGRWINTGSLVFSQPQRAARYTLDEVLELAAAAGFSAPDVTEQRLPYMCSPASRHGRVESVVTFGATKERGVQVPDCQRDPAWLERHDVPIPALPQFQSDALTMRIYGYLATLIDGRRSIRDIAQELVRERLMTADAAEPAVRSFVGRLLEDAQRRPRF